MSIKLLSIDPSINATGWAVWECMGEEYKLKKCGVIKTKNDKKLHTEINQQNKIKQLFVEIQAMCEYHGINTVVIETQYVSRNVKAALVLTRARTAIELGCLMENAELYYVNPTEWQSKLIPLAKKREETKIASIRLAQDLHKGKNINNSDVADAILMGEWFFTYGSGKVSREAV